MEASTLEGKAQSLEERHSKQVMEIASMCHITHKLIEHYSRTANIDMSGTVKTLNQCVESHCIDRDIHPHALAAAIKELQEVGAAASG